VARSSSVIVIIASSFFICRRVIRSWPGFACRPLTEGFKQTNSRRHADVKTFHLSPHWDLNEKIAFFLRESA